jgi:hydrogenase maturation protease
VRRLVIGVGNPDRGDDGVGPAVARALRTQVLPGVDVVEVAGEPTSLLAAWEGADQVVLIDAMSTGAAPGTVLRHDAGTGPLPPRDSCSTHGLGVEDAIALGRALGALPRSLVVFGVEAASFTAGDRLSPGVAGAVPDLVDRILAELAARPPPG